MSAADELKRYKELYDTGVITLEEFEQTKAKLLQNDTPTVSNNVKEGRTKKKNEQKKMDKKWMLVLGCVVLLIAGIFAVNAIGEKLDEKARIKAVEAAIEPIMHSYQIEEYKVKGSLFFNVYCEEFEDLSNSKKYELIKKLNRVEVDDPVEEGEELTMLSANVYVSPSGYYYTVNSLQVNLMGYYDTPGLYYSDGAGRRCVYESDN